MNVEAVEQFCKNASQTFFNDFGLISHQINSFDHPFDCSDLLSSSFDRSNRSKEACHHYR